MKNLWMMKEFEDQEDVCNVQIDLLKYKCIIYRALIRDFF